MSMGPGSTPTWAIPGAPARPSLTTYDGLGIIEDAQPADPSTMPSAAKFNAYGAQDIAIGAVVPNCTVSVTVAAGVATLAWVTACNPAITLVSGTLTLTRVSAGVYWITWPPNTFPPQVCGDKAYMNTAGANSISASRGTYGGQAGVNVTVTNSSGQADGNFTVDIM